MEVQNTKLLAVDIFTTLEHRRDVLHMGERSSLDHCKSSSQHEKVQPSIVPAINLLRKLALSVTAAAHMLALSAPPPACCFAPRSALGALHAHLLLPWLLVCICNLASLQLLIGCLFFAGIKPSASSSLWMFAICDQAPCARARVLLSAVPTCVCM